MSRVFVILALLLFSSSFLQVSRCQENPDDEGAESAEKVGIAGGDGENVQYFDSRSFIPAPGVDTVTVFPKNPKTLIVAGEESELLVGIKNNGKSSINVVAIHASVHLPFDHRYLLQNLSSQTFPNASVSSSAQSTFPYIFGVSKFLQSGEYDLVGTVVYEIDLQFYQSTFYNGTIEVTEAGNMFSVASVLLSCLGIALLGVPGVRITSQIQHLSKKTKRDPKVEVGTATTNGWMDEWLQGTAYAQSTSNKSKKKK